VLVSGAAWAGEDQVRIVEISTDQGATWHKAAFAGENARYAWRLWSYTWRPHQPGAHTILSRATDSAGRVQPETGFWNPGGYLYNAIDRVEVHVES
jgi:hypothetical protein